MKTTDDPIAEVHMNREQLFAQHGYDLRAYAAFLNAEAAASGRRLVTRVVKAQPKARFHGRTSRQHRDAALAAL